MNIKKAIPYIIFVILIFIIIYQKWTINLYDEAYEIQYQEIKNLREIVIEYSKQIPIDYELFPDTLIIGNDTLMVRKDSVDVLNETRFK